MSPLQLRRLFRRILLTQVDTEPVPVPSHEPTVIETLCDGRHPARIERADFSGLQGAGGYLARMAHFEAAAVGAFSQLADELEARQSPPRFVELARSAAREEAQHAAAVAGLARKRGAVAPGPKLGPAGLRTLEEIALENAIEGCVREAFGALVGLYQSAHAGASDVRSTMRKIADDEIAHAAFALELHQHFLELLDAKARARLEKARQKALAQLLHRAFAFEDPPYRDELGLPPPDVLFDLARAFREALGSEAARA